MQTHVTQPERLLPLGRRTGMGGRVRTKTALALSVSTAGLFAIASPATAEAPPAGTLIGNQASAVFTVGGEQISVLSNIVFTEVNPVFGVDIETDSTKPAIAGETVTFTHTVTNTGNTPDSFLLELTALGELGTIQIFGDDDCDGAPNNEALAANTTPVLNPGESYCVAVIAPVDAAATLGGDSVEITATSTGAVAAGQPRELAGTGDNDTWTYPYQDSNLDTIEVTNGSIIDLTKSVRLANGEVRPYQPGDEVTIRLFYDSIGGTDAGTVRFTDDLGALDFDGDGTPDLSVSSTPNFLSPSATNSGLTVEFTADADTGVAGDQVEIILRDGANGANSGVVLADGVSGYVEFDAIINSTASEDILNTANVEWDDVGEIIDAAFLYGPFASSALIPLQQSAGVALTLADTVTSDPSFAGAPTADLSNDNLAGGNDIVELATASNGDTIEFPIVLTNHSNSAELFTLSIDPSNGSPYPGTANTPFPAGTTFQFLSGGAPLAANQVSVGSNSAATVTVRALLPIVDTATLAANADPYEALVTATSVSNPAEDDQTVLSLGTITERVVDLFNIDSIDGDGDPFVVSPAPSYPGEGNTSSADQADYADPMGAPWTDLTAEPGQTAIFGLRVLNDSDVADSFNLASTLPSGWQVTFRSGSTTTAPIIANTGLIPANGSVDVYAFVRVPEGTLAGTQDVVFEVTSATSGATSDSKLDAVTVPELVDIAIREDREGQVAPGGVVTFTHTIENVGNVGIDTGEIAFSDAFNTLNGTIYLDTRGATQTDLVPNGVLDIALDQPVSATSDEITTILTTSSVGNGDGVLDPGESFNVFVRVQAPSNVVGGLSDAADISVTGVTSSTLANTSETLLDNNVVTDLVTVVSGDLEILKEQALDPLCNGTLLTPPGYITTTQPADPGECIAYRVTATNTGAAPASDVEIRDSTPAFTTMAPASAPAPAKTGGTDTTTAITAPSSGAAGPVTSLHGDLAPGGVVTLTFTVQIDD